LLALFAVFVLLGFTKMQPQNFRPFFSQSTPGSSWGGLVSVILVLQIVPYFLTGFESVPKLAEEASSDFKPAGYVRAIFLGLAAGTLFYVLIIGVVSGLVPWKSLLTERFGTAVAFDKAFHSPVMVRLIFGAALLSLLKVFNANFLTASRLIFALGRRELIPSRFGEIHPDFHSPKNAVLFCGLITAIGALLGSAILVPITEVGSMCSALGWTVTCIAYTRWQKTSGGADNGAGIAILGALVAIVFLMLKILWFIPGSFGRGEYIALATWLLLGLALWNRKDAKVSAA